MANAKFRNVRVKLETHRRLTDYAKKDEDYDAVIKRLLDRVDKVYFEVLSVDSKPPQGYTILYALGNAKYLYSQGKHTLVATP
jgi:hypothetical protein